MSTNVDAAVEMAQKTMNTIEGDAALSYEAKCMLAQLTTLTVAVLSVVQRLAEIEEMLEEKL